MLLALIVLYGSTSPATVALEDDGFFILASWFNGVAHPPGYPLYTLIGKLFTFLPFGSVAWRVHLSSALFGAASGSILYLLVYQITFSRQASFLSSIGLGLSPVFWSQSIISEVYTLNTFFFLTLFLLCYRLGSAGKDAMVKGASRYSPLSISVLFGLSLANHWPLMLLASPALLILLMPAIRHIPRIPLLVLLSLAVALIPYLWIMYRSASGPEISFIGPIESLQDLVNLVTRKIYAQVDSSETAGWFDRSLFAGYGLGLFLKQFIPFGTILSFIGISALWRSRQYRLLASLLLAIAGTLGGLLVALGFDYDELHKSAFRVYLLIPFSMSAILMGLGFKEVTTHYLRNRLKKTAATLLVILVLVPIAAMGWHKNNRHGYNWSREYATALLDSLPENSVLFVWGDISTAVLGYYHLVERMRPDIEIYSEGGLVFSNRLFKPGVSGREVRDTLNHFINTSDRRIFFVKPYQGVSATRYGLYNEVHVSAVDQPAAILNHKLSDYFETIEHHIDLGDDWSQIHQQELYKSFGEVQGILDESGVVDGESNIRAQILRSDYGNIGYLLGLMGNRKNARNAISMATKVLQRLPDITPNQDRADLFTVLGWAYLHTGRVNEGIEFLRKSIDMYPKPDNRAIKGLYQVYKQTGMGGQADALRKRFSAQGAGK